MGEKKWHNAGCGSEKKVEASKEGERARRLEPRRTEGVRTWYHVGEGAHDCDEEGVLGIE